MQIGKNLYREGGKGVFGIRDGVHLLSGFRESYGQILVGISGLGIILFGIGIWHVFDISGFGNRIYYDRDFGIGYPPFPSSLNRLSNKGRVRVQTTPNCRRTRGSPLLASPGHARKIVYLWKFLTSHFCPDKTYCIWYNAIMIYSTNTWNTNVNVLVIKIKFLAHFRILFVLSAIESHDFPIAWGVNHGHFKVWKNYPCCQK